MLWCGALGLQISFINQSLDVEIDTVYVLATPEKLPTEDGKVVFCLPKLTAWCLEHFMVFKHKQQ